MNSIESGREQRKRRNGFSAVEPPAFANTVAIFSTFLLLQQDFRGPILLLSSFFNSTLFCLFDCSLLFFNFHVIDCYFTFLCFFAEKVKENLQKVKIFGFILFVLVLSSIFYYANLITNERLSIWL